MKSKPLEVLLLESDGDLSEMIERCLCDITPANVTCVAHAADAMREELTTRHEIIIASLDVPEAFTFARELRVTNRCPLILMAEHPTTDEAIAAIRLRARDLLTKPFDVADMVELIVECGARERRRRHHSRRQRRLRRLTSRILRDRRDLRQRMDLICQDVVHAYRGLAQKVASSGVLIDDGPE